MTPLLRRLLIGNAALAAGVWLWLEIPLAAWWQVALNALLAAAVVGGALWLYGRCLSALSAACLWALIADGTPSRTAIAWVAAAVLLLLLLPVATRRFAALTSRRYWLRGAGLVIVGGFVPWALVRWPPPMPGLVMETASLVLRFAAAYFLANWAYARLREHVTASATLLTEPRP